MTKLVRVFVKGGIVQAVETPAGVTVEVYDYDGEGRELPDQDDEGCPCTIATW